MSLILFVYIIIKTIIIKLKIIKTIITTTTKLTEIIILIIIIIKIIKGQRLQHRRTRNDITPEASQSKSAAADRTKWHSEPPRAKRFLFFQLITFSLI